MSELKFDKDTLSVISVMSKVNPKVMIEYVEDKMVVKCKSSDSLIAYHLEAPKDHFGADGDYIAFYNYPEFYSLVDSFEGPSLSSNENSITIKKNNTKVNYRLSDESVVKVATFKKITVDPDYKIELPASIMASLKKFISIIKAEKVKLSFVDGKAEIKVYNEYGADTTESVPASLFDGKSDKNFSLIIHANTFDYLPGGDYSASVDSNGLIEFEYHYSDEISLKIYTSEIEEA